MSSSEGGGSIALHWHFGLLELVRRRSDTMLQATDASMDKNGRALWSSKLVHVRNVALKGDHWTLVNNDNYLVTILTGLSVCTNSE